MLTLAATLAVFAYGLNSALLGALLPIYSLTASQRGYVGLANALGLMVASVPAGRLIDSKGKKPALLLGLGSFSSAYRLLPTRANTPVYC